MNKISIITLIIVVIAVVLPDSWWGVAFAGQAAVQPKATYIWDRDQITANTDSIFTFMKQNQANMIFLQRHPGVSTAAYEKFIQTATANGINVYALDGAADWVGPEGPKLQKGFFDWLQHYQQSAPADARFKGVHLDLEPYMNKLWKADYQLAVQNYQDCLDYSEQQARALNLTLNVDIPAWLYLQTYATWYGSGNLAQWVINHVDGVTIMAYKNKADAIIKYADTEIFLANQAGKPAMIAVETQKSLEGPNVSFYGMGSTYLNQQLSQVEAQLKVNSCYYGLAIHYLPTWMAMNP